jgi:hypothetical protein
VSADLLTISEAAEAAGCTPAELRVWHARYGWPPARRTSGGYRLYDTETVAAITRVVTLRNAGTAIGDLIGHGAPLLAKLAARPDPLDLSGLVVPATRDGAQLHADLLAAIRRGLSRTAIRFTAESNLPRIHPSDRAAILALVERYEGTPS